MFRRQTFNLINKTTSIVKNVTIDTAKDTLSKVIKSK